MENGKGMLWSMPYFSFGVKEAEGDAEEREAVLSVLQSSSLSVHYYAAFERRQTEGIDENPVRNDFT